MPACAKLKRHHPRHRSSALGHSRFLGKGLRKHLTYANRGVDLCLLISQKHVLTAPMGHCHMPALEMSTALHQLKVVEFGEGVGTCHQRLDHRLLRIVHQHLPNTTQPKKSQQTSSRVTPFFRLCSEAPGCGAAPVGIARGWQCGAGADRGSSSRWVGSKSGSSSRSCTCPSPAPPRDPCG